jgi:hypothetical protein
MRCLKFIFFQECAVNFFSVSAHTERFQRSANQQMPPPMIPWHKHFSWPWMVANGCEHQADEMIPQNSWSERLDGSDALYIPGLHGIYIFENKFGERFCWYAQAHMIAFQNKLYYVASHRSNMIECYTWYAKQISCSNHLLVVNTDFQLVLNEYGHLLIRGSEFDRYSGRIRRIGIGGAAHCIRCIPDVPWWLDNEFNHKIRTTYATRDQVMPELIALQRKIKQWACHNISKRKKERHAKYRHGWLKLLPDDVFELIVQRLIEVANTHHCVRVMLPEIHLALHA